MEMEFFVKPGTDEEWHQYWIDTRTDWYVDLGIARDNLRQYEHPKEKLSHYSKRTVDIEYRFHFAGSEWGELEGIANRTDFDLTTHSEHSGVDLSYFDQETGERWTPYVIEPAAGVNRSMIAFLLEAYAEDEAPNTKGGMDKRIVLRLDPRLAPVKAAVLPLSRHADLSPVARDLAASLRTQLERRVRRRRPDRPPLPPAGRDRHAVLPHGRLRDARRPGGHHPRPGLDDPGAGRPRPGAGLPRRAADRLLRRISVAPRCLAAALRGPTPAGSRCWSGRRTRWPRSWAGRPARSGRTLDFPAPAERARTAVRKAIARAVAAAAAADPAIGAELRATVTTGYSRRYTPPVRRTAASRT